MWDDEAQGHWLTVRGNLMEMLRKTAPGETGAVREEMVFAEDGCGGTHWTLSKTTLLAPVPV